MNSVSQSLQPAAQIRAAANQYDQGPSPAFAELLRLLKDRSQPPFWCNLCNSRAHCRAAYGDGTRSRGHELNVVSASNSNSDTLVFM